MAHIRSKKSIVGLVVLILLIIGATVLVVINPFQYLAKLNPPVAESDTNETTEVTVQVETVQVMDLQNSIKGNGSVIAPNSVDVYAEVSGTLTSLSVKVGQMVEKDQVLAVVDPSRAGVVYKSSVIKAPASGTILSLPFVEGATVGMQAPIARIGLLDTLEVVMDIAERHIGSVELGTEAVLSFKAFPSRLFKAQVIRLSPMLNAATRTLEIGLSFEDPEHLVKSGMFPSITLNTERLEDVLAVQRAILLYSKGQAYVYVVDDQNIAHRKDVTVGLEVDDMVEIASGLQEQDQVVVQGQSLLTDGALVRITR